MELVDIYTLSPGADYYYRIKVPKDIQLGLWLTEIAFFTTNKKLVYHRKGISITTIAPTKDGLEFVKWSADGKYALFLEFKLNELCNYVLLNLESAICYRLRWTKQEEILWNKLPGRGFDIKPILRKIKKLNIQPQQPYKDSPCKNLWQRIFGLYNWYPRV